MSSEGRNVLLRIANVSKTFGETTVLNDVSLDVASGEIVAILGHNGSGKSTLVKILAGVHTPDPGSSVQCAGDGQIHFIHQELGLVNSLSSVENLGVADRSGWRALMPLAARSERRRTEQLLARFGATFDVTQPVGKLSAAERAMLAIARAMQGWDASGEVLVLDEPTAALHRDEVHTLLEAVRRLASNGAGIIYISHRLDEVMGLADRVVILRDGRVVTDLPQADCDRKKLVSLIAGRELTEAVKPEVSRRDVPVLRARGMCALGLAEFELDLYPGEIVGVSGTIGSGRDRIGAVLFGATARDAGELSIDGRAIAPNSPAAAINAGVGFVPADRTVNGGVMTLTARENLTLPQLQPFRGRLRHLRRNLEDHDVTKWLNGLDVRPPEPERQLQLFSGGNQQKVVIGKWLRTNPKVLLLDEPTAGVDVGAMRSIYNLILGAAGDGTAVLICSSDTKELATLSDRVLVMRDGVVTAELPRGELTEARLIRESLAVAQNRREMADVG
jgi:ABC-type sugar transport system ATPase subunit